MEKQRRTKRFWLVGSACTLGLVGYFAPIYLAHEPEWTSATLEHAHLQLGQKIFYTDSFGNEEFLSRILGFGQGPLRVGDFARALFHLGGRGTTNLRVEFSRDVRVGREDFQKGQEIDTGIDVPRGSYLPLGFAIRKDRAQWRIGVTCAACHSTVDPVSFQVQHGIPNSDLRAGLLLAMASNSAAYVALGSRSDLRSVDGAPAVSVECGEVKPCRVADAPALETAVDARLMQWPPGTFDSIADGKTRPAKFPSVFALPKFPDPAASTRSILRHGFSVDARELAEVAPAALRISAAQYLAQILQAAPDPSADHKPALRGVEKLGAIAAWRSTLSPAVYLTDSQSRARGREVFERGGCVRCHSGDRFTSQAFIGASELGSSPAKSAGGYAEKLRVPSLIGLAWRAPYLHDGGVAVGPDEEIELGLAGTWMRQIAPDPRASLGALIDRELRKKVVLANRSNSDLRSVWVDGSGHPFWIDPRAGFSQADQQAVIAYLFSLTGN